MQSLSLIFATLIIFGTQAGAQNKCGQIDMPGKTVIAENTFSINFPPFGESCFVALGEGDAIRDPELHIFKAGRSVYRFPDPFREEGGGCVVRAVAFDDINQDGKPDVTIVGACQAAGANFYNVNAIYLNTGQTFTTDAELNRAIRELKTMKAIRAFVKKNSGRLFGR